MSFSLAAQTHLAEATAFSPRWALWLSVRDRATDDRVDVGLWNGDDDATLTIDDVARVYIGAQSLFEVSPVVEEIGTTVRTQGVSLSGIDDRVEAIVRGYDLALAPAELHLILLHPTTGAMIGYERRWRGVVTAAPLITPPVGGRGRVQITLASGFRGLTAPLPIRKSDEAQQARSGDRFRRYGSISAAVRAPWGAE